MGAWKELMLRFPNATVVDTVHPHGVEGWLQDVSENSWGRCFPGQQELMSHFISCCNFDLPLSTQDRLAVCRKEYESTHEEIQRAVPAEKLLTYSVDMGYKPLCDALGVPASLCSTEDLPHAHSGLTDL